MQIQLIYVFILIALIIILMAKDLGPAYSIALLSVALSAILLLDGSEYMTAGPAADKSAAPADSDTLASQAPPLRDADMPWAQQNPIFYPREAELNQGQTDTYSMCYQPVRPIVSAGAELDSSVDGLIALNGQKRARDKKCLDGATLKDADFFKYYYDDELRLNESRPWWGDAEY